MDAIRDVGTVAAQYYLKLQIVEFDQSAMRNLALRLTSR
jgi:hypothetical protein